MAKLRCRAGDTAILQMGEPGKLVRVARMYVQDEVLEGNVFPEAPIGASWVIEALGCSFKGQFGAFVALDSCLTPIRPQRGRDEMLRIAGMPRRSKAKVRARQLQDG